MFLINSRLSHFTATLEYYSKAPLLPKLRGYFAEFLRGSYLAPLCIFNLPTCVGFRYGLFYSKMNKLFLSPAKLRSPLSLNKIKYRNINLFSIGYVFRPHLRSRLTHRGRTFQWNP